MKAMRATTEEEAEYVLKEAFATNAPVLLDFHVHPGENVYPMVAPGKGLHEMVGVKW